MVIINNISDEVFELNGLQYVKIYNPLAQGYDGIGIYQVYDTRLKLVTSVKYNEFVIDTATYNSQAETMAALLAVIYNSKISEIQALEIQVESIDNRVDNLEENQVTGVVVYETIAELPATGTLLVSYKVSNDPTASNNGYYHWNGSAYIKDAELNQDIVDELETKITIDIGENLINPDTVTEYRYLDTSGNVTTTGLQIFAVSDYIEVNGQDIISSAYFSGTSLRGYTVYDVNKVKLRTASEQQYTYQAGDYYVRFGLRDGIWFANYGTELTDKPFTFLKSTDDIYGEIKSLNELKVDKVGELINLVNLETITRETAFNSSGDPVGGLSSIYFITDYIIINESDIISNCFLSVGNWSGWVAYDINKTKLRWSDSTKQYDFQAGEIYIRFSFSTDSAIANEGTVLEDFQEYSGFGVFDQYRKDQISVLAAKVDKGGTVLNLVNNETGVSGAAIDAGSGAIQTGYASNYYVSDYIEVNAQDIISNSWFVTGTWASMNVYDQNKTLLRTVDDTQQYTYQAGDYYIRLGFNVNDRHGNYGTTLEDYVPFTDYGNLDAINKRVGLLETGSVEQTVSLDGKISVPNNIYTVCNDEKIERNYSANLYLSHLLKGTISNFKNAKLFFSNLSKKMFLNSPFTIDTTYNGGVDKSETTINETILSKEKFIDKSISFKHRSTLSSASKAESPKVLCIGDSITSGYLADKNKNPSTLPSQYWAFVKMLFEMDKIDGGDVAAEYNINLLGRSDGSFSLDYDSVSGRQLRAFSEAEGGANLEQMRQATWGGYGSTNPFFDGVDFSVDYYLEQWRTMDDDGNRLYYDNQGATTGTGGSLGYIYDGNNYVISTFNIGVQVTDTEAFDVCTPTHIVIQMVQNSTLTMFQNNISAIISVIQTELPSCKIILMGNDCVGSAFPEDYPGYKEEDIYDPFELYHNTNLGMVEYIIDTVEDENNGVFCLANLYVAPDAKALSSIPLTSADSIESNEIIQETNQAYGLGLYAHPNNKAHSAWGYQLYSLLKYILTV